MIIQMITLFSPFGVSSFTFSTTRQTQKWGRTGTVPAFKKSLMRHNVEAPHPNVYKNSKLVTENGEVWIWPAGSVKHAKDNQTKKQPKCHREGHERNDPAKINSHTGGNLLLCSSQQWQQWQEPLIHPRRGFWCFPLTTLCLAKFMRPSKPYATESWGWPMGPYLPPWCSVNRCLMGEQIIPGYHSEAPFPQIPEI